LTVPLTIPSPDEAVWDLGPFPLRAYALCIILGVVAAIWIADRRWVARGGASGQMADLAVWAVPFGIVGGRLYHVATDNACYFRESACEGTYNGPWGALYVWQGGLGIWGAIAFGALGAWLYTRRHRIRFTSVADAAAPGLLVAQAIGRWGNWFNQELFGRPLDAWWALEIDVVHRPAGYEAYTTFHPTFLYESLWNLAAAALIIWADRRFRLGHGRVFALYVAAYCAGRVWIEALRIDPVEADDVLGLRLNVWTSIVLFVLAAAYFVVSARRHPGREDSVYRSAPAGDTTEPEGQGHLADDQDDDDHHVGDAPGSTEPAPERPE
jgi:prolipoprotein diacylglyceryl transferase